MLDRRHRLLVSNNVGGVRAPRVVGSVTWTDNGDGTATVTFTTDIACYAGVDYGTVSGTYTKSAFDYTTYPTLELATSHTVEVPDVGAGGTESDGTYYFRAWAAVGGFSGYITSEASGDITSGVGGAANAFLLNDGTSGILLNNDSDVLLMN